MNTSPFPRMHISLYVSNIEATIKFYDTFFGQPATKTKVNYAKYILESPSLIISFVENKERVQQNFGHLGFEVASKDEVMLKMLTLKTKGILVKEEMGTNCCYALQDKFWATDPDGVQWEVYYFHADSDFNDPHYTEGGEKEAAACCMPPTNEKKRVNLSDLKV
jgi:catechol 2,3-dioxygenase-like lactoylglutathione lyase family enzyme